jgi:3-oxoacyl-[acyl-carrier protein] reductase
MTETLTPEARQKLASRIPLARLGKVPRVTHAVKFLASDDASYITGQVLNVNGGMYV